MNKNLNQVILKIVDLLLLVLGFLLLFVMAIQIFEIAKEIFKLESHNFEVVIHEVLSFFLIFEFFTMILKYIEEGHHIPIRYLIYICITAILRHEIANPTTSMDTLLVAISIFVLVIILVIIQKTGSKPSLLTDEQEEII